MYSGILFLIDFTLNIFYFQGSSHVQVKDIRFIRVSGTSASEIAVNLNCSSSNPCYGIELNDINLSLENGGKATSWCSNARVSYTGTQNPATCQQALAPAMMLEYM